MSRKTAPSARRAPLTHFLCIPLVTALSRSQLEQSISRFRDAVCENGRADVYGIHPDSIRPVGTLHCTLGVMSLSKDQLAQAEKLLASLDLASMLRATTIAEAASPLQVDIRDLVAMHEPTCTSVLYARPMDATDRLYPFCLELQRVFIEHGFIIKDERPLKLHATIINTVYVKARAPRQAKSGVNARAVRFERPDAARSVMSIDVSDEERDDGILQLGNAAVQRKPKTVNSLRKIDATQVLERYANFVFANDVLLDRLAICEMGAKKEFDQDGSVIDEKYNEVVSFALPSTLPVVGD